MDNEPASVKPNLAKLDLSKPDLTTPALARPDLDTPDPRSPGGEQPNAAKRRDIVLATAGVALTAGFGLAAWQFNKHGQAHPAVETFFQQSFPQTPQNKPYALQQLRGKSIVLNFWATWCAPCVEEMPELSELAKIWEKDLSSKVKTIGLAIDSEANVHRFYEKLPVAYPLLAAGGAGTELLKLFGNASGGLPFTVLIHANGGVSQRILGRFKPKSLDAMVRQLAH